jgi:hypothetical protein
MLKTDERTEKRTEFTLSLTADELTWLWLEVFPAAIRDADGSFAAEMRETRDKWRDEMADEGWVPF